jgi:hypothetical protein
VAIVDPIAQRAAKKQKREFSDRLFTCEACARTTDTILGGIHSALPCDRCGVRPCVGAVVLVA